jgi:hypothetical protein
MGQRIPTRGEPGPEDVECYIRDMVRMMIRLADDASLVTLSNELKRVSGGEVAIRRDAATEKRSFL